MSAAIDDARRTSARFLWLAVVLALPCLFILLPMIAFLIYGFWHVEGTDIVRSFSPKSYVDFLGNEAYVSVFFKTFALALKVMAINLLLGYPVAYFISTVEGRRRYYLILALIVPLLMSYIIKIYAMRAILGPKGLLNQALLIVGLLDKPSDLFLFNMNACLLYTSPSPRDS